MKNHVPFIKNSNIIFCEEGTDKITYIKTPLEYSILVDDFKNGKVTEGKFEKVLFLEYQNKDINAYEFISNNLKKEIEARNLPIKLVKNETTGSNLYLNSFKINSQQTTGFTPLTTFTKAKLTLEKDNEKHKIVSVIKRAKMLMLSVNESYEPCYYEPTSVVVQEIVAKLNIALFNYKQHS